MKRLLIYILLITSFTIDSFAQDALFVYHTDGNVTTIFLDELNNIRYSKLDTADVEHDDYVAQIIETSDSVYCTMLCDIDSVGFHSLPMELKCGAYLIDNELLPYVTNVDEENLSFTLSSSTPHNVLPNIGDKIATLQCDGIFSNGFAGKVANVTKEKNGVFLVICDEIDLTEIFKTLYVINKPNLSNSCQFKNNTFARESEIVDLYHRSDEISIDFLKNLGSGITFTKSDAYYPFGLSANNFGLDLGYDVRVRQTIVINEHTAKQNIVLKLGTYAAASATLLGKVSFEWGPNQAIPIPLCGCPFAKLYLSVGPYFKGEAELGTDISYNQTALLQASFCQDLKTRVITVPADGRSFESESKPLNFNQVVLNGKIGVGAFVEVGASPLYCKLAKNAKLALREKLYFELDGDFILYKKDADNSMADTRVYDRFRNATIGVNTVVDLDLIAGSVEYNLFSDKFLCPQLCLVPELKANYYKRNGDSCLWVAFNASDRVLIPVTIGARMLKNSDFIDCAVNYTYFDNDHLEFEFKNPFDKEFLVYPTCNFFGLNMLVPSPVRVKYMPDIQSVENVDAFYSAYEQKSLFEIKIDHNLPDDEFLDEDDRLYFYRPDGSSTWRTYKNDTSYCAISDSGKYI